MPLNELLPKAEKLFPQKEAIVCGDLRMTYKTFARRVRQLSNALAFLGCVKSARVAIIHENCHIFLEAYFACAGTGMTLVPVNIRLSPGEIANILNISGAEILIIQNSLSDKIINSDVSSLKTAIWTKGNANFHGLLNHFYEQLISGQPEQYTNKCNISDNDIAHLYFTSGTTGKPKGVMLTHKNVKTHALASIAEFQLTEKDNWLHAAPLFHLADAWAAFAVTWAGGKHVMIPGFNAEIALNIIQSERIKLTNLIPTMLNMMLNFPGIDKFDYSSLRALLSGGAPIAPEIVKKTIEKFKCDYIQTYGMTETSPYLTVSILKDHLKSLPLEEQLKYKSSTGREFINISLKVVNENGEEVLKNNKEVGEIIVKGDSVTPGYWNQPEETAKAFRDGWLLTGDLAVIDEEEYVTIVDRKKDMIITGGENVYSTEVENMLYEHPAVMETAVIGLPDSHWGEIVAACVVIRENTEATEEELIAFCKGKLAHYKAPKKIFFLDSLPRTGSGKIYKKELKIRYT